MRNPVARAWRSRRKIRIKSNKHRNRKGSKKIARLKNSPEDKMWRRARRLDRWAQKHPIK